MSNFLLHEPDCVLIHIPKNGGSTIRKGLWQGRYDGPVYGRVPDDWRPFFKFAFVRHPLDRLVSAWADFTQLRGYRGTIDEFVEIVTDETLVFDERRKTVQESIRHHTLPQTHPFNCLGEADHVGRFEKFDTELRAILDRVGLTQTTLPAGELLAIRKTVRPAWQDVLTGETLEQARIYYAEDLAHLGYSNEAESRIDFGGIA